MSVFGKDHGAQIQNSAALTHPPHNGAEMGQSLYLCSDSAGFCCWGLGKGRPFPHVKAWGGTAQITTQGHRGTFFRVVFRYLAIAALSFSGPLD
jgi:hypothetical protein